MNKKIIFSNGSQVNFGAIEQLLGCTYFTSTNLLGILKNDIKQYKLPDADLAATKIKFDSHDDEEIVIMETEKIRKTGEVVVRFKSSNGIIVTLRRVTIS